MNQTAPETPSKVPLILMVVGALLTLAGGWWIAHAAMFVSNSVETVATVVSVERQRSPGQRGSQGQTFRPTFEFETSDGPVTASPRSSSSKWNYPVGMPVVVRYLPGDPQSVAPANIADTWGFPVFVCGFGIVWFAVGARMRKQRSLQRNPLPDPDSLS